MASASASASAAMRCGASNSTTDSARRAASASSQPRALAGLGRHEAGEGEPAGLRIAGHAERGHHAAGAGQRHARVAGRAHRRHQRRAGVGDGRRAGIADVGHALAARQALDHAARPPRARCARAARSAACRRPSVRSNGALTRVSSQATASTSASTWIARRLRSAQVADRRGHDVQRAGRIAAGPRRPRRRPAAMMAASRDRSRWSPAVRRRQVRACAAEERALAHLQRAGLVLVERNYRVARGPARARRRSRPDPARPRRHAGVRRGARARRRRATAARRPASARPSSAASCSRRATTCCACRPRRPAASTWWRSTASASSGCSAAFDAE